MFYTIGMAPSSREPRKVRKVIDAGRGRGERGPAATAPPVSIRPKATPRRSGLSVEAIVDAAIAVLDESGVAGLSMRRVADRLGTGAASLYAYVSGRTSCSSSCSTS